MDKCFNCSVKVKKGRFRCDECIKGISDGTVAPVGNLGTVSNKPRFESDMDTLVDKGVTKRDLVQPYKKDGKKNQIFSDLYGDGMYNNQPSELDGRGNKK